MEALPDKERYTNNRMTLAGAIPDDLAPAIQADPDNHRAPSKAASARSAMSSVITIRSARKNASIRIELHAPNSPTRPFMVWPPAFPPPARGALRRGGRKCSVVWIRQDEAENPESHGFRRRKVYFYS